MVHKVNVRIKLQATATRWVNHGDHPSVNKLPEEAQLPPGNNKDVWGCLPGPQGIQCFPPNTWIIDIGGNTFAVDDQYYLDYYEEVIDADNHD